MYKGPEVEKLDVVHLTLYCAPEDFIKRQILIQEFWVGAKLLNFSPAPRPCRCCWRGELPLTLRETLH